MSFSVYDSQGERRASAIPYAGDAAALVAALGRGSEVRFGRKVVWREGDEEFLASESYDEAADVIYVRAAQRRR